MPTEPKQLTPTERVNKATELATNKSGIHKIVRQEVALELATELEQRNKVCDDYAATIYKQASKLESVQMEFANAQLHWNQERDKAKYEYRRLFETWQYDCKIWKERIDVTEKERDELKRQVEQLKDSHCKDCCCAQSWKALGISKYTGKSIPEHINQLRAENTELRKALERLKEYEASRNDH